MTIDEFYEKLVEHRLRAVNNTNEVRVLDERTCTDYHVIDLDWAENGALVTKMQTYAN